MSYGKAIHLLIQAMRRLQSIALQLWSLLLLLALLLLNAAVFRWHTAVLMCWIHSTPMALRGSRQQHMLQQAHLLAH
jgi:hypothetical protein